MRCGDGRADLRCGVIGDTEVRERKGRGPVTLVLGLGVSVQYRFGDLAGVNLVGASLQLLFDALRSTHLVR